ncbi:MAG: hypothetical protein ACPG3X_07245, partial [Opitutales bacterium]
LTAKRLECLPFVPFARFVVIHSLIARGPDMKTFAVAARTDVEIRFSDIAGKTDEFLVQTP